MRVTLFPLAVLCSLAIAACDPPTIAPKPTPDDTDIDTQPDTDTDADTDTDTDTDADADADADTDADTDTGMLDYDCSDLPSGLIEETTFPWARGYHDVVFDLEGNIIGQDAAGNLMKATYDEQQSLWIPNIRSSEGMDRMPDGSILYGSWDGGLTQVTPDGARVSLVPNAGDIHGITVGPDHKIYYANTGVYRYDPETGLVQELIPRSSQRGYRHLVFNLDSTRMYIATLARGQVWYVDLDEDLNPVGEVMLFATEVGGSWGGWHDGIGIDACGNLYVAEYYSGGLYRVSEDATVELLGRKNSGRDYGHGLEWGSGIGGWKTSALYQPLPYDQNKVKEVLIGVPSGHLVRTWNGEAVEPW